MAFFCSYIYYLLLHWFQQKLCLSFYVRNFWDTLISFDKFPTQGASLTFYDLCKVLSSAERDRDREEKKKENKKIKKQNDLKNPNLFLACHFYL